MTIRIDSVAKGQRLRQWERLTDVRYDLSMNSHCMKITMHNKMIHAKLKNVIAPTSPSVSQTNEEV